MFWYKIVHGVISTYNDEYFLYSVKYLAFYSCCLCSAILLRDLWTRLADKSVTGVCLFAEFVVQGLILQNLYFAQLTAP